MAYKSLKQTIRELKNTRQNPLPEYTQDFEKWLREPGTVDKLNKEKSGSFIFSKTTFQRLDVVFSTVNDIAYESLKTTLGLNSNPKPTLSTSYIGYLDYSMKGNFIFGNVDDRCSYTCDYLDNVRTA